MKKNVKVMSVTQYAAWRGISRAAVHKRIIPVLLKMNGVIKVQKIGSTYILYVNVGAKN